MEGYPFCFIAILMQCGLCLVQLVGYCSGTTSWLLLLFPLIFSQAISKLRVCTTRPRQAPQQNASVLSGAMHDALCASSEANDLARLLRHSPRFAKHMWKHTTPNCDIRVACNAVGQHHQKKHTINMKRVRLDTYWCCYICLKASCTRWGFRGNAEVPNIDVGNDTQREIRCVVTLCILNTQ